LVNFHHIAGRLRRQWGRYCKEMIALTAGRALAAALALLAGAAIADDEPARKVELVWELSAYYTDGDLYIPLSHSPIPETSSRDELEIYRQLFLASLTPQVLLFEASVYPMPLAGTWMKRQWAGTYDNVAIGGLNLLDAVTAGFQEPAAVSMFLGSALNFVEPGRPRVGTNKGHMGYLFSFGTQHIKDNVLLADDWYEFEWKLKGERNFVDDKLSWSFRVGTQQHSHPEVSDTVYVGLRRGNLDYNAPLLSWLTNSSVDFLVAATTQDFSLARAELLVEKRLPSKLWGLAVALQTGFVFEGNKQYSGALRDDHSNFLFVLRPNLEF